jgi:hypothetical protein
MHINFNSLIVNGVSVETFDGWSKYRRPEPAKMITCHQ